jgi:hypothetical protein
MASLKPTTSQLKELRLYIGGHSINGNRPLHPPQHVAILCVRLLRHYLPPSKYQPLRQLRERKVSNARKFKTVCQHWQSLRPVLREALEAYTLNLPLHSRP